MRNTFALLVLVGSLTSMFALGGCGGQSQPAKKETPKEHTGHQHKEGESCPLCDAHKEEEAKELAAGPLGLTVKDIDGKEVKLDQYCGKVVMIVNVASKCGLTNQYEGLEKLYAEKKDKGLVILGFPANNFMGQEPGTDAEIKTFCTGTYKVTFPMFSKISVKGDDQHELYKRLTAAAKTMGGEPSWNFTKYVLDREGKLVARFDPKTKPNAEELVKKIDELLAAKHEEHEHTHEKK